MDLINQNSLTFSSQNVRDPTNDIQSPIFLYFKKLFNVVSEHSHVVHSSSKTIWWFTFNIRDGTSKCARPIHKTIGSINGTVFMEPNKGFGDSFAHLRIHGEHSSIPIHRATKTTHLLVDRSSILLFPFPDLEIILQCYRRDRNFGRMKLMRAEIIFFAFIYFALIKLSFPRLKSGQLKAGQNIS